MTIQEDLADGRESIPSTVETEVSDLATSHSCVEYASAATAHRFALADFGSALEQVYQELVTKGEETPAIHAPAEWFLDNYYIIRRIAHQFAKDLPAGFIHRLPRLTSGADAGLPRIHVLAREVIHRKGAELDRSELILLVGSYQKIAPLSIAELWALPTMLRAEVLDTLLGYVEALPNPGDEKQPLSRRDDRELGKGEALDAAMGVERSIRELRLFAEMDWQVFFAQQSHVEAVLQQDPAQIYSTMDFDTCDSYRKAIEDLAWNTGIPEEDVAQQAVSLASQAVGDARLVHVGYYLVGSGRATLEDQIDYRPVGLDRLRRFVLRTPTFAYFTPLVAVTIALMLPILWYAISRSGVGWPAFAVLGLIGVLFLPPIWSISANLVHWMFAKLLPPRRLPKLDYSDGVPEDARTLVVIPTQLAHSEGVHALLQQLERHFLANPDPMLGFALLTDYLDASEMPEDGEAFDLAAEGVRQLNVKHGVNENGPFLLLHREPRWNPAEDRFMGWERKRGKLEELNRLLRGDVTTSFTRIVGDREQLQEIRFVLTLDTDTELPLGAAHRLIGLLAHPLNRAVFDPNSGRVLAGYTIVQPRLATSPTSTLATRFARIFGGNASFDIYTHASSELYQDLFGSGIYCGKGIYDVDAFSQSLEGRVPENRLASHDLFEGVHGRTALASDIVLYEQYPAHYGTYSRRMHRWVRGDWQLFPWLRFRVPADDLALLPNRLSPVDRWKIADNLRRSVVSPSLCLLLVLGWLGPLGDPLLATLFVLGVLWAPLLPALVAPQRAREVLARGFLSMVFLLHEATVVVDAITRVFVRTMVTRKHMLQWTSAASAAVAFSSESLRWNVWRDMYWSVLLAALLVVCVASFQPSALVFAGPVLAVWVLAPEVARWLSLPEKADDELLDADDVARLRLLARRTWLFFETFVGPEDQWLPIDNYQEAPREQIAHRTSPTNIGLMLVSTLSAYDLGYIGASELSLRLRRAFDSIGRLARYRGHLLNWYDTKTLEALSPQYVSTVDSGNLAGCLLALKTGCSDVTKGRIFSARAWRGLGDSLALVEDSLSVLDELDHTAEVSLQSAAETAAVHVVLADVRALVEGSADASMRSAYFNLVKLCEEESVRFSNAILSLLQTGVYRHEADELHTLQTAMESFEQHLHQMRRELDDVMPWLSMTNEPAASGTELFVDLCLDEIPEAVVRLEAGLKGWALEQRRIGHLTGEMEMSCVRLYQAFAQGGLRAKALRDELMNLASRSDTEAYAMEFGLLFDGARKLFHIGYNVTADQIDPNYYDLLASEARLASFFAIVKRDVPESHWYAMGRPMSRLSGGSTLLSWGGTMFEYLMPSLLMRSRDDTLLQASAACAVNAQIAYAAEKSVPWGISESSFSRVDAHETYQYRSFGVPGLGFKRDLDDDLVVAPYASLLALSVRPKAVVDNLARLYALGMGGRYGLFEAVDFHSAAVAESAVNSASVVRSYMSHHQGMLFVALDNYLNGDVMVERFHAEPAVGAGQMLLNERAPYATPTEWPFVGNASKDPSQSALPPLPASSPWIPEAQGRAQAFAFGNGRLSTVLTGRGGGGLSWEGLALTRFQPDPTCDGDGIWFHVRDEDSGNTWLATSEQGRTIYTAHSAEFHQRDHDISVHVAIAIAPADDVEMRRVTLHNESASTRQLSLTSAGEPVLLDRASAAAHPAFGRLFVESEFDPRLHALIFSRRPRSAEEKRVYLVHSLVWESESVSLGGYQTDRSDFFGRSRGDRPPIWLTDSRGTGPGRIGWVIDPIMALTADVVLAPNQSVTFAFVTSVARSRSKAVGLAAQYGSLQAVRWAFQDAKGQSPGRLARWGLSPDLLPCVQRLYSALLFVDPTFRMSSQGGQSPVAPLPAKNALWGHGISGDLPIVVASVDDSEAILVGELVVAQRYLRSCDFAFDLVFLDEDPSNYVADGLGTLRNALARANEGDSLHKSGGVHVLSTDQVDAEGALRLKSTARVLLDTRSGSLAEQMNRLYQAPPRSPRFEPTLVGENILPATPARHALLFDNGTGGFSEDGREYVTSVHPDHPTPAPWSNVIANADFGCLVSESSLGSTWSENAGENRLTPWRNDPVRDVPSEVLYLRDEETAAVWSATPLPAGGLVQTEVRHGAGYTTYLRESHGLQQELTIFVPTDAPLKIARLRLTNLLSRSRRLTATYYVEWLTGQLREETSAFVGSEFEQSAACLLASCDWNNEFAGRVAFLAAEQQPHGFTTDRSEFLGRSGNYALPEALTRWGLSNRVADGGDPCGAIQMHLELGAAASPASELVTHFVLGQASSRDEAVAMVRRYRQPEIVEASWRSLSEFWDDLLGTVTVKTPDPAMDLMLNRWLLYQALSSRIFGRTAFYQSSGAFGFRDQLQDVLALFHTSPDRARAHILESATHQFVEGDVLHWWHPPTGRGVRTRCSDDMAWLPYVVSRYVAATGDGSILDEQLPFLAGDSLADGEQDRFAEYLPTSETASLLEHCRRALECALTAGVHGLPLIGDGDWNDGMNRVGVKGVGESVWLGWFLCSTMNSYAAICETVTHDSGEAALWRGRSETLRVAIEASAWDGDWYVRAFHDDGSVLGSESEVECRIDSIAQSWAVLSGVGDAERATIALRAAEAQLVNERDRLVLLLRPPFNVTQHDPGYIKAYPPGVRENGGQYTHAATWLGLAHAAQGDGRAAARIFDLINPILRSGTAEEVGRYRAEPYVLTGDVYSSPTLLGRGGWSWYTGSASWAYRLGIEGILGLYRVDGDLCLDPCIPPEWPGFEAWVRLGTAEVHVVIENPDSVSRGIASITLDGISLDSNCVETAAVSETFANEVRLRMGKPSGQILIRGRDLDL